MLVPRDDALRFIDGYRTMLLRVLADTGTAASEDPLVDLAAARSLGKDNPGLFEAALCSLAADGRALEPAIATAIRSLTIGLWFYLRQGKTYAVMLDGELQNAYAVRGLTTPLSELFGKPPFAFETGLFEFEGYYVCDGLVTNPVAIGPGYRTMLNESYTSLRNSGRFHARAA